MSLNYSTYNNPREATVNARSELVLQFGGVKISSIDKCLKPVLIVGKVVWRSLQQNNGMIGHLPLTK